MAWLSVFSKARGRFQTTENQARNYSTKANGWLAVRGIIMQAVSGETTGTLGGDENHDEHMGRARLSTVCFPLLSHYPRCSSIFSRVMKTDDPAEHRSWCANEYKRPAADVGERLPGVGAVARTHARLATATAPALLARPHRQVPHEGRHAYRASRSFSDSLSCAGDEARAGRPKRRRQSREHAERREGAEDAAAGFAPIRHSLFVPQMSSRASPTSCCKRFSSCCQSARSPSSRRSIDASIISRAFTYRNPIP